jgi:hypothetical protein
VNNAILGKPSAGGQKKSAAPEGGDRAKGRYAFAACDVFLGEKLSCRINLFTVYIVKIWFNFSSFPPVFFDADHKKWKIVSHIFFSFLVNEEPVLFVNGDEIDGGFLSVVNPCHHN